MRSRRAGALLLVLVAVGTLAATVGPSHAAGPPEKVQGVRAAPRDGGAMVYWSAPEPHPDIDPVTGFVVHVVETGRLATVNSGAKTSRFVGSLQNGHSYTFRVAAVNAAGTGEFSDVTAAVVPTRPNVVLVVADDQRFDTLGYMPKVSAMPWLKFLRAYVNEPQCCPSRASILTGRYSHHTGVETLRDGPLLDESTTLATMLQGAGYRTGFAGKYLNNYPFGRGHYVPPGWSHWAAFEAPLGYFDYVLNENGTLKSYGSEDSDYSTDRLSYIARWFIRGTPLDQPLYFELAPLAPHRITGANPVPAPRHVGSCASTSFPLAPSFNGVDTAGEPSWMAAETNKGVTATVTERRAMCETLRALDEGVDSIVKTLAASNRLENTYIVYVSDNGYSFGEHRLIGKGHLYESSVRVPLLVRGPDVVAGSKPRLTSNVDIAPSILDWARVTPPAGFVDGNSFADFARGSETVKPVDVLLRGCRTSYQIPGAPCGAAVSNMGFNWGLRTGQYKYVVYDDGYVQLFDLVADPQELTNLALDPAYAPTILQLQTTLATRRGF
jgi:arylsulfatase A-like enzyme